MKAKKANKKPQTGKTRRNPLNSYKENHCKVCIGEDVDPKWCDHNPETCYRRKGGELDQKNIKDPKKRNIQVSTWVKEKRRATQSKKAQAIPASRHTTYSQAPKQTGKRVRVVKTARSVRDDNVVDLADNNDEDSPPPSKKPKNVRPDHVKPHLWVEGTEHYKKGYEMSEYAYRNPLTPDELDDLITDDILRHKESHLELTRQQYHRWGKQKFFQAYRSRYNRAVAAKAATLKRVRSYEPNTFQWRKTTKYVDGYERSNEALLDPLNTAEINNILRERKTVKTPRAVERLIKEYEGSDKGAIGRITLLREDKRIADMMGHRAEAVRKTYKSSSPGYVHPNFAPLGKTYGMLMLNLKPWEQCAVMNQRVRDIALALHHENGGTPEDDGTMTRDMAFKTARTMVDDDERPENPIEYANRVANIKELDKADLTSALMRHRHGESRATTRALKLELQGRISRLDLHLAKIIARENYKPVGVPVGKGAIKITRDGQVEAFDPVRDLKFPETEEEYIKVTLHLNKYSKYIKDYGVEGTPSGIFNTLRDETKYVPNDEHRAAFKKLLELTRTGVRVHNLECHRDREDRAQHALAKTDAVEDEVTRDFENTNEKADVGEDGGSESPMYNPTPVPSDASGDEEVIDGGTETEAPESYHGGGHIRPPGYHYAMNTQKAERERLSANGTAETNDPSNSDDGSDPDENESASYTPSSSVAETDHETEHEVTQTCPMSSGHSTNGSCPPLGPNENLEWHEPPKKSAYEARVNRRKAVYQELFTDVLDLPDDLWCPASLTSQPIARHKTRPKTNPKSKRRQRIRITRVIKKTNSSKRLWSETKGERLLQAYVKYRGPDGIIKEGRIELDTMSNVNYTAPGVSLPRKRRPYEATKVRGISNQTIRLGKPTAFTLMRHDKPVVIDSVKAPPDMFEDGCIALLGLDAIATLGIDINYLISHLEHTQVKFLTESDEVIKRAKADAIERYPLQKRFERYTYKQTFLSERICAKYLEKNPDDYESVRLLKDAIDVAPHMNAEARARILQLLHQYGEVFATRTNTLPKPMKGTPPHSFKLKEDAVPSRTGRPKFGPAQTKIITQWVEWALAEGLIEPAKTTSWSSRLILAPKYKANTPKSALPDGIRVAWAGVQANDQIQKTIPTYPDAWEELYKVANYKYKFSADGLKQYWSIPLETKSREVTAFWTPQGLYQFTRLVMGTKNAATVAQNAYTHALHTLLPKESFPHMANFADDFLGGADTVDSLLDHFENFLKMCKTAGITLNPQKIRIGYEREQFYGLTVDNGKIEPAERNLDPIKKMTPPKNRSELRSIMGVFNQFGNFVDNFQRGSQPAAILNSLISPKVEWDFTDKHVQALEDLKKCILEGDVHLYAPNHDLPLYLETDASDDGWGAVLFQKVDGKRRTIKMWSRQWKTEAWLRKPPYHREAKAWMNGLTLTIPYALYNKHPVQCYTDHTPLTWIKYTSGKGPVSQFIIDNLSVIDYEMHYLKGEENEVADGLSRFPMIGPSVLRREGVEEALNIVLAAMIGTDVPTDKIWFYANKDTKHLVSTIYDWRDQVRKEFPPAVKRTPRCYNDLFSAANIQKVNYTLGIWAPVADKVTEQCRAAFLKGKPFACLIPNDLVCHIARDGNKQILAPVQQLVDDAFKITLLSPGLTWIIHGLDFSKKERIKTVYTSKRVTPDFDLDELMKILKDSNMTPPVAEFATRQDWIAAQKKERCELIWRNEPGVYTAPDGLLVVEMPKGTPIRTIVPSALQIPLVTWQHRNVCHVGYQKVLSILKKKFFWKNMRRTCKHVTDDCALCNLLKARFKMAHKHFRAKLFCTPRTAYGADYYAVKANKQGYCQILGMIDLSIGYLSLSALKQRTAANTAHELFYEIVVRKGVPLLFHSDAAREFLSVAMKSLSATLGIVQTNTLAHNPKSNAKIERVWQFVGRCLQSMTPEQYAKFHKYTPIMAHVWNTVPDSDTGITPFEAQHGMKCRSVLDSVLENPPREGLPATAGDLRSIATSVNAFIEHIKNVKAVEKTQAALKLNADGTSKIEYNLGDKVGFFLPPDEETVRQMNKKKKHILRYVGPGELVEALSPNGTSWKILYKGRHYNRSVTHLTPYRARGEVPPALQVAHDDSVWVGSYVAVQDNSEDNYFHIGQVIDITDQLTTIHYMGTRSRNLRSAVWKKLYHHPGTRQVVNEQPENLIQNWTRFTGEVPTQHRNDSLIVLSNLGFIKNGILNAVSRNMLSRLPLGHHIMRRTWNP